jgi:PAS domain S-box-containing protein
MGASLIGFLKTALLRPFLLLSNKISQISTILKQHTNKVSYPIFMVGLCLSLSVSYFHHDQQKRYNQTLFEKNITRIQDNFKSQFDNFKILTKGTSLFFSAQQEVTQEEWNTYVKNIQQEQTRYHNLDLLFIENVDAESGAKAKSCIVKYFTALKPIATDVCTIPEMKKAFMTADVPSYFQVLLRPALFSQEEQPNIFSFYAPIFKNKKNVLETKEDKETPVLIGWILTSVRLEDFFKNISLPGLKLRVFDTTKKDGSFIFSDSDSEQDTKNWFQTTLYVYLENQIWEMRVLSKPNFGLLPVTFETILVFLSTMFLTILIAWLAKRKTVLEGEIESLSTQTQKLPSILKKQKRPKLFSEFPGVIYKASYKNSKWIINFISSSIFQISGYHPAKFLNKNHLKILSYNSEDIKPLKFLIDSPLQGKTYHGEYRIKHTNGQIRWVYEYGKIIKSPKTAPKMIGVIFDITQAKEKTKSLPDLALIFQEAPEGLAILDLNKVYVSVNSAYAKMFKMKEQEMIGKNILDYIDPEDHPKLSATFNTNKPQKQSLTVRAIRNDKSLFYKHILLLPIQNDGDNLQGYYCFAQDDSEHISQEKKLIKALENAEKSSKIKSEFLATISHEIRTSLNSIIGYGEMLLDEAKQNQEISTDLTKINTAAHNLLEFINNVLDLSKIEAGKVEFYMENFDIYILSTSLMEMMIPLAKKNNNTISLICSKGIGKMYSDYAKVRQSILNLLSNACKFTKNGTIILEVSEEIIQKKSHILFAVKDTGAGIEKKKLKKLFKPYGQADASIASAYGGTGLGLTITKSFCEMLQGKIKVQSKFKEGSVFTLMLPRIVKLPINDPKQATESKKEVPLSAS